MNILRKAAWAVAALFGLALFAVPGAVHADQCINDDVIVDGSECVGFDCVCNMAFGFDTQVYKENNLRVFFDDTSTASSFPRNDWRLVANDSANGGAEHFSIQDATASRYVFRVFAGARSNALVVDSGGDVGIGTATPVTDIHVKIGDTPTLRLEQDGSSGFTPQTWDLAGNETNFFVRDVTNGSALPFRIRPGAPTSSIDVDDEGNVGIGTSSPDRVLHMKKNGTAAGFHLETTGVSANSDWFFEANGTTGAFIVSEVGGGAAILNVNQNAAAGSIVISPPGAEVARVGIGGVANSNAALDVNGAIFQRGGSLHADYVFEPDYELEPIEAHAEYMWENKHLPAVGGATYDDEGRAYVDVGQRTRGVLEELEKAHIYIEQLHLRLTELATDSEKKDALLAELASRLETVEQRQ